MCANTLDFHARPQFSQHPCEVGIAGPVSSVRMWSQGKIKPPAQGFTDSKRWSRVGGDSNSGVSLCVRSRPSRPWVMLPTVLGKRGGNFRGSRGEIPAIDEAGDVYG